MKNTEKKDIIIVSGGFDPLHEGHIDLFNNASKCLGEDKKIHVLLNSDEWLARKKGSHFQNFHTRKTIIKHLNMVEAVHAFDDDEQGSCVHGIAKIVDMFKHHDNVDFHFCNGGDRNKTTTPEDEFCAAEGVNSIYEGEKKNSSSHILKAWKIKKT